MQINTDNATVTFINEHIVLVETNEGVILDKNAIRQFYAQIERHIPGEYTLIINRRYKYKILRHEVYSEANAHDRLRGIAIVTHGKTAGIMAEIEAPLSKKPFATFSDLDNALDWAKALHGA